MKLAEHTCTVPIGGTRLSDREIDGLLLQVPGWTLREKTITREFKLKNFHQAMDLVKKLAVIADEQKHHPDIYISYNIVRLTLITHSIGSLSLNDFIFAAKVNLLVGEQPAEAA